jgi:FixJ family two-component response regulator
LNDDFGVFDNKVIHQVIPTDLYFCTMQITPRLSIIEDDIYLRDTLKKILLFHKFEVLTYCSAEDFLSRDSSEMTDLILSDINMPGMDGFQLLHRLQEQNNRTPVILMSGDYDLDNERVLELGASAFMSKPFHLNDLLREIHRCIQTPS